MGVSTGQWRAAIGRWPGARGVTLCCSRESESSRPPGFFGLVLAALLLLSGVEPNPGPVYKSRCELCGALFTLLSEEVEKKERAVSEKERSLLELERQLQEKDRQLTDKQELLESRMNQFQDRENDVKEREVVLEKKEGVLSKRDGQISERECHISERERLVSGREALILVRENNVSGRESVVSQRESLFRDYKALALKKGSLVSECSSVVPDPQRSTLEQAMVEATVHTQESGGEAVPTSPEVLLEAAAAGRLEDVWACLEGGGVPVDCQDEHGRTPMLLAAQNGHLHVVQFLVKQAGADINMKTFFHETALHLAVREDKLEMVRFLVVDGKCNVDIMSKDKQCALHLAVINNNMEILQCLLRQGKADVFACSWFGMRKSALHEAVRAGNLEAVRLMVQARKVDFIDKHKRFGRGIVGRAAGKGYLSVVRFLVEHAWADPNARSDDLEPTALHKAVLGQHLQVVIYLVEKAGASLTAKYQHYRNDSEQLVYCTPDQLPTSSAITKFLRGAK